MSSYAAIVSDEMLGHYTSSGYERERLSTRGGPLELLRTQVLLQRFLPPSPAVVLDVGGGPGVYSAWLARLGYEVHLGDFVPLHARMAREQSAEQPDRPIRSAGTADARRLPFREGTADAVLLLGPLYHLTERDDRLLALSEAHRAVRDDGLLFCAAISRFASVLDGLRNDLFADPEFVEIAKQDLATGQHRNETDKPMYFTTAYFHHPDELGAELLETGFQNEGTFGIEGPGWLLRNLDQLLANNTSREELLTALQWIEQEPTLIGASAHLLAVGRKV